MRKRSVPLRILEQQKRKREKRERMRSAFQVGRSANSRRGRGIEKGKEREVPFKSAEVQNSRRGRGRERRERKGKWGKSDLLHANMEGESGNKGNL